MDVGDGAYLYDAIAFPKIHLVLMNQILARLLPQGPADFDGSVKIDFAEDEKDIKVATPFASGTYYAPWTAKGSIEKDSEGKIEYDLVFTYTRNDGKVIDMILKGVWGFNENKPEMDYSLDSKDYDVYLDREKIKRYSTFTEALNDVENK